jgi:hypothetical protein
VERISEQLSTPLLSRVSLLNEMLDTGDNDDKEKSEEVNDEEFFAPQPRVASDIGPDPDYRADWTDHVRVCAPEKLLVSFACVFLILASVAEVYVLKFTGAVLDSLVDHVNANNKTLFLIAEEIPSDGGKGCIIEIPGFVRNIELLIGASLLDGIFGGLTGSIYTISSRCFVCR